MTTKPVQSPQTPIVPTPAEKKGVVGATGPIDVAAAQVRQGRKKPTANSGPEVQISDGARARAEAMQRAFDLAKEAPEIRADRVADLKKKIDSGTYQIDAGQVADGMLREAILEHLAEADER